MLRMFSAVLMLRFAASFCSAFIAFAIASPLLTVAGDGGDSMDTRG